MDLYYAHLYYAVTGDTITDYATNLLSILMRLQKRDALTIPVCFDDRGFSVRHYSMKHK